VTDLRCEYLQNPMGIDVLKPRFSWTLESEQRGVQQAGYRIQVASAVPLLEEGQADVWDSGWVESDATNQIVYTGPALESRKHYYWQVRVRAVEGSESLSQPAEWSMGLLEDTDWKAGWIGLDRDPYPSKASRSELDVLKPMITIQKAIYGVVDDPEKSIDIRERVQAHVDKGNYLLRITNDFAGTDPAYEIKKQFKLEYVVDGRATRATIAENAEIDLTTGRGLSKYLPAPYLRREFAVDKKVQRAVAYATAQGVYELHLNGQRVSDEVFMPGWTDYRKRIYYRAYDVTDLLQDGSNAIGAILGDGWFRGNISCIGQNQYGKRLRLKAQLMIDYTDGSTQMVATASDWKAGFGPILESDMQAGEVYDARLEMTGWSQAGFDATEWFPVDTGTTIHPVLQAYPGVPVRALQELPTLKLTEPKPGRYVFDLGQNFSGWIWSR